MNLDIIKTAVKNISEEFENLISVQENTINEPVHTPYCAFPASAATIPAISHVDNSWNTININSGNVITTNNITPTKSGKKDTDDKKSDEKKNETSPALFLICASALAFGGTYLIATDNYQRVVGKFETLDRSFNLIRVGVGRNPNNHVVYNNITMLEHEYNTFKTLLVSYYKPAYIGKWGILGSGLIGLGSLLAIPFASFISIAGITYFGCTWLWHSLTNDSHKKIIELHSSIKNRLKKINDDIENAQQPVHYAPQATSHTNIYPPAYNLPPESSWSPTYSPNSDYSASAPFLDKSKYT